MKIVACSSHPPTHPRPRPRPRRRRPPPPGVSLEKVGFSELLCKHSGRHERRRSAQQRRERQLRARHRHVKSTVATELATALHHSVQRVEAPREGVEGEKYYAPRRPKPPLPGKRPAPLVEVAEPEARLVQHSGIGYELVMALDVPVLQMAEQSVDASALAFLEEAEEKALEVEYLELARTATSHDSVELREVVRRMHVLRQKGGGEKKKRRKRRVPRSPHPRLVSWCCLSSTRARHRLQRTAWFYSGYMFLPRSQRLSGSNSTLFPREGGACAVRTWKPGLSTLPRYLARTCLVSLEPEEHRKVGISGSRLTYFYEPLYMTVTCSAFAFGVQE